MSSSGGGYVPDRKKVRALPAKLLHTGAPQRERLRLGRK